jgi:hydroxypyruvate reductase
VTEPGKDSLRAAAFQIFRSALQAGDVSTLIPKFLKRENSRLTIGHLAVDRSTIKRLLVIGAGKASGAMAHSVEEILGDAVSDGLVVVKDGYRSHSQIIRHVEAGHPIPDARGQKAAQEIITLAESATADDLILCLLSGGGSALLPAPITGISLADKQSVTQLLLTAGATINELNTIRKHLSRLKGGQLARLASPARVVTLILSDVIGDRLDVIASGPTAPDDSTYADAWSVLDRFGLLEEVPRSVLSHLERGRRGEIPDTSKRNDPLFDRVTNLLIGNNRLITDAALSAAQSLGFTARLVTAELQGDAREAAKNFTFMANEIRQSGASVKTPACLIAGGETTVTVKGSGKGGRCQEFCLASALAIEGLSDSVVFAAGTDGTDGPTDAAGAIADGTTVARGRSKGLSAEKFLENHDSYNFFSQLGDLVKTGPTNTNLLDLYLLLVAKTAAT